MVACRARRSRTGSCWTRRRCVGHLVPAGTVYAFLAEHRQRLFPDELFADLFGSGRGRPSVPADVIATVMVLQSLEGLSDREALQAVRTDLRWKVAAGLAFDDEGFHPTVLTLWRNKLRPVIGRNGSSTPCGTWSLRPGCWPARPAGRSTRRCSTTRSRRQDTVTQLVSMIRRVRRAIPAQPRCGDRARLRRCRQAGMRLGRPGRP